MAEENPSSLPQEEEPNSKRQKMSTTTTSDDEENPENNTSLPRKPRYKRRKIAIFFAYCGVGYQGMQKNPGAKTIEGDLEEALYFSGAVPEADRGLPRRFDWARSARTDKGVSAVGQVIRIFGFKRVTASFNAKKFCDRRRYVYLIPVFALDPSCHRDRESVLASLGSGKELAKCLECSERGRKVFGVMGKRSAESKTVAEAVEVGSGISSNSALGEEKIAANSAQNNETGNNDSENNSKIDAGKTGAAKNEKTEDSAVSVDPAILSNNEIGLETRPEDIEKMKECEKNANGHETSEKKSEFCYGEEQKERFNRILKTVNINVPMAPEVGLYLDECFFSSYNQKWKDSHEELSMKAYADEAEEFKMKYIYTHIASTEHKDGVVALWLHSLNYRNYPDLRAADNTPTSTSSVHENEVVDNCPSSDKQNEILNMDE
ncbi:UNVERIFIED_CONTAM: tRNA pseudouridine synthase A [Sesamum calycinum]|uniref:tRNA pseudouridine synthase A n=1 Tax=Sesamum calycinum TaxID=2727403 RepID=A0AAW2P8U6_9LAMI